MTTQQMRGVGMSIKPVFMGKVTCSNCGSKIVKVYMMSFSGVEIEHADINCAICDMFIIHVNLTPYEEKAEDG